MAPPRRSRIHHRDGGLDGARERAAIIAAQADGCFGVLERPWLLEHALTPREVDAWLGDLRLRATAFRGVYVLGHLARVPGQAQAIALSGCGPASALAGATSADWQRVVTLRHRRPIEVIVPKGRANTDVRGLVRRVAELHPEDVHVVRGLRCATPERTVIDLPGPLLREALQELMRRSIAVEPLLDRIRGRPGAPVFRDELGQLVPQLAHTMSELEARYVRLCHRHRFELPVVNGTLERGDLLDCTWPGRRLVVELDGRRWHQHRDREDRRRDRERTLDGWVPLRFDWWDVTRFEARTARDTARGLAL